MGIKEWRLQGVMNALYLEEDRLFLRIHVMQYYGEDLIRELMDVLWDSNVNLNCNWFVVWFVRVLCVCGTRQLTSAILYLSVSDRVLFAEGINNPF